MSLALDEWLTLKDAAERLGIHPTTLRRWADTGHIPYMMTAGGHRRFATADVLHMTQTRRGLRAGGGVEQVWAQQALTDTRAAIPTHPGTRWLVHTDEERESMRSLGRRLMGVLMQYIALPEEDPDSTAVLQEAQNIGREYGTRACQQGLSLTESLQATMFFRDSLVETALNLPENTPIRPSTNTRLLRRISHVLNQVQLAVANAYEKR